MWHFEVGLLKQKVSCLSKENFCRGATFESKKFTKSSSFFWGGKSDTGTFFELLNFFELFSKYIIKLKVKKFKSS